MTRGTRSGGRRWTRPEDIRAAVLRRWTDGTLLRAYAAGEDCPPMEVPLRGPSASTLGDDLTAAQQWVGEIVAGGRSEGRYAVQWTSVGGRHIGRTRIPARALVTTYAQAWSLLGVAADVRRFSDLLTLVAPVPAVRSWVLANPHRALDLGEEWPALLAAHAWLAEHRGSGAYLRQISAPGVDTKFAERHRAVLADLLGVSRSAAGFITDLGLRARPQLLRMRPGPGAGLPGALRTLTEVAARPDEAATLPVSVRTALVVENEITYLSVPVPDDGIVLWGKGFEADAVGGLPWLGSARVHYWGDLDTHGFAILNRLRAWLPHTTSVLMDRDTLLAHRDRWGAEPTPTRAHLARLAPAEAALYDDLVTDRLGERIRLEQERIDWTWALEHLSAAR